jgi:hypothetical protein
MGLHVLQLYCMGSIVSLPRHVLLVQAGTSAQLVIGVG